MNLDNRIEGTCKNCGHFEVTCRNLKCPKYLPVGSKDKGEKGIVCKDDDYDEWWVPGTKQVIQANLDKPVSPLYHILEHIRILVKAEKEKSYREGLRISSWESIKEATRSTASQIIEEIDENIAITQRTHRVGSHSDDYGGDSDLPCDCDKEQVEHQVSALKSLKQKIISKFKLE